MLSVLLHRKRKAAEKALAASKSGIGGAVDAIELTQKVYGVRLLVRGLLWLSIFMIARGLLEMNIASPPMRAAIALLPTPFFAWYLWTWMKGVSEMDELQRRIELEALALAFPLAVVLLMTLGLLDVAIGLSEEDFSIRHVWAMMPVLYYFSLWRAKRRYE
ncbi:MAG TPA: hypothetical protein VNT81_05530 [Vicinamibacterales bacterium]|nr:hypothetical protein [Vicinamibacterales bacterium]